MRHRIGRAAQEAEQRRERIVALDADALVDLHALCDRRADESRREVRTAVIRRPRARRDD